MLLYHKPDLKQLFITLSHSSRDFSRRGSHMVAIMQWMGQESSQSFFIHLPGGWCWLLAVSQNTYMEPFLVTWASSQHGGWVSRVSIPRGPGWHCITSLPFITSPQKAHSMIFAVVTGPFRLKGGETDATNTQSQQKNYQCHIVRRACGRSCYELSSLPQFLTLSKVSPDRSQLLPSTWPPGSIDLGVCPSRRQKDQRIWSKKLIELFALKSSLWWYLTGRSRRRRD